MNYDTSREPLMNEPIYHAEDGVWQFGEQVIDGCMVVDRNENPRDRWIVTDTTVPIEP